MQGLQEEAGSMQSTLLKRLVTPGQGLPDMQGPLDELLAAADWDAADADGRVKPTRVSTLGTSMQDATQIHPLCLHPQSGMSCPIGG